MTVCKLRHERLLTWRGICPRYRSICRSVNPNFTSLTRATHPESGRQPRGFAPICPPAPLPLPPSLYSAAVPRVATRWTGAAAGVPIDPEWQVASGLVAWREWPWQSLQEGVDRTSGGPGSESEPGIKKSSTAQVEVGACVWETLWKKIKKLTPLKKDLWRTWTNEL